MPAKTKNSARRSKRSRVRNRQPDGQARQLRARQIDSPELEPTGSGPARFRIDITRLGSYARFRIVNNSDSRSSSAVTSSLHKTPKEVKAALIELIQALKADDFDSYDFT